MNTVLADCKPRTIQAAIFLLCIDEKDGSNLSGRLFHPYHNMACEFTDLTNAVLQMDKIMNELEIPQAATMLREFPSKGSKKTHMWKEDERDGTQWIYGQTEKMKGSHATVSIQVHYRQHSSWQGEAVWNQKKVCFRSVLELLHLLTEVEADNEKGRK